MNPLKMRNLVVLVALIVFSATFANATIDLKNPVKSAEEDEIKSLPGLNYTPNFKHYSGYLEADDLQPTNRFWHYWFTESQNDPSKDPLVLWLNGGPGCSSLLALLFENGPMRVSNSSQIEENPYSWNKVANVIYMESPAGVGFSYALNGSIEADDDSTAAQNHQALRSFFRKFPQFKDRPLYLAGESYAGVYLPTLALLVEKDPEMNLKGVAIGNGYLDAAKIVESAVFFTYHHGLVGTSDWSKLSELCCSGQEPSRGACKFSDLSNPKCVQFVQDVREKIMKTGLNPYNVYDRCPAPSTSASLFNALSFDYIPHPAAFNQTSASSIKSTPPKEQQNNEKADEDPFCIDYNVTIYYLNNPLVKQALHIPEDFQQPFKPCFDEIKYTQIYPFKEGGLAPQINELINSPKNLTLLVYNGDTDMICNFLGDEWFVDDLDRRVIKDYSPWYFGDQVAGYVKHFDGISYQTIKGAGHGVPFDKPAEALHMFKNFLNGYK